MDYFDLTNINDFKFNINQPYSSENKGTIWFNDTKRKINYLIDQFSDKLNMDLIKNYNEVPNKRNGPKKGLTLKPYVLVGFIPEKHKNVGKDIFLKISMSNFDNGFPNLNIECDLNFSDPNNKYKAYRQKILDDTHWRIKIDQNFPRTWENLIEKMEPIIENRLSYLNDFLTKNKPQPKMSKEQTPQNFSLNQILYGPPGTGKTYHTINKAIQIVNPDFDLKKDRAKIKEEYERLVKNGQVVFTTFHQSISYEDFIEGIKPTTIKEKEEDEVSEKTIDEQKPIQYEIQDGIFKRLCQKAKGGALIDLDFEILWKKFYDHLMSKSDEVVFKSVSSEIKFEKEDSTEEVLNVRFKRTTDDPDKEGRRLFHARKNGIKKIFDERLDVSDPNINTRQEIEKILSSGRSTIYNAVYKSFFDFSKLAEKFKSKKTTGNFVLIIDEINRGNVSQIFGELITLIEEDKRIGKEEALEVILPYSKKPFGVPANLYIIGTMNTADRSVEALDAALRRRFTFEEMAPKPELLTPFEVLSRFWLMNDGLYGPSKASYDSSEKDLRQLLGLEIIADKKYRDYGERKLSDDSTFLPKKMEKVLSKTVSFSGIDLSQLLSIINQRIEKLLDKDHQIGHSYLINVYSLDQLKSAFQNKIIPLLQEYFFGDYGKIGLILGEEFFEKIEENDAVKFKKFNDYEANDFSDRKIYRLKNLSDMEDDAFKAAIIEIVN
ncbi:5-methylcytosine-specific restriction protein B [Mongoliibacter ruber]|uniref:5-methylcytosine-specific restriction protein B n=2 Tax=Mongoliibacter ruber TaxID=1750599 RepID=A0A2T0WDV2_9BACT|nr:5-methylcytosine-specific restriction protein B [Mongoliibacter ruber]